MTNRAGEKGQSLVLFAMLLSLLVLIAAIVIDGGIFMVTRRHAQNVVDAAALAGAQELPDRPDGRGRQGTGVRTTQRLRPE